MKRTGVGPYAVFRLEQIAEREGDRGAVLLFDANVRQLDLLEETYDAGSYRRLDIALLTQTQVEYDRIQNWLAATHLRTVEGVREEWRQCQEIVAERTRYWNKCEESRIAHHRGGGGDRTAAQQQLVAQLNESGLHLTKTARHKILHPDHPELYRQVVEAVREMGDRLQLKHSPQHLERQPRKWRRSYADHRTDEHLAAMALYLTLVEGKPSAIVSGDGDVQKLLCMATDLLSARKYLSFSMVMRERFTDYPCRLYLPVAGRREPYHLSFDSAEWRPQQLPGNGKVPFSALRSDIYIAFLRGFRTIANHRQERPPQVEAISAAV